MNNQPTDQPNSSGCSECNEYRRMDEKYRREGKTTLERVNREWWDAHKLRDHMQHLITPAVEWNNGVVWVEIQ